MQRVQIHKRTFTKKEDGREQPASIATVFIKKKEFLKKRKERKKAHAGDVTDTHTQTQSRSVSQSVNQSCKQAKREGEIERESRREIAKGKREGKREVETRGRIEEPAEAP